jgi:hypothetical protein
MSSRNFGHAEDALLIELVKKHGTDSWSLVAAELGTRTPRQCRNRYTLFLAPDLNSAPWTPDEDEVLIHHYEAIGPKWAALRQFFPGRTDLNVKNRFLFLARNRPEARRLKEKFAPEPRPNVSEIARNQFTFDPNTPGAIDSLFQSLPYYMKRCFMLEKMLEGHQIPVPPQGICDRWVDGEVMITSQVIEENQGGEGGGEGGNEGNQ